VILYEQTKLILSETLSAVSISKELLRRKLRDFHFGKIYYNKIMLSVAVPEVISSGIQSAGNTVVLFVNRNSTNHHNYYNTIFLFIQVLSRKKKSISCIDGAAVLCYY